MIFIDVEKYVKAIGHLPKGDQVWEFQSLPGDPPFYFKVKGDYSLAKKKASSKYRSLKNHVGIFEVKPTLKRAP